VVRYLLSIAGSLAVGAAWWGVGVRTLHLGVYTTIFTGVLALALGFLAMGYLWLSIDLSRPAPEGVDEQARNTQLFVLWMGMPLIVILILAVVGALAILVGHLIVLPRRAGGGWVGGVF